MTSLVFDTGPIITLAMNNLLWVLRELKTRYKGEFYITPSITREVIERPLTSKKFKFEALQVLKLIQDGVIKEYNSPELKEKTLALLEKSNNLFKARGNYIKNVQYAEMEAVVASMILKSDAVVIDEFVTRYLLERPMSVKDRMERKLHEKVVADKEKIKAFEAEIHGVNVIRSFELVVIAYELGLFEKYYLNIKEPKETLLEGLLWAVKLNGSAVTEQEINEVKKIEGF